MKKILSIGIVLVMMLTMAIGTFAATVESPVGDEEYLVEVERGTTGGTVAVKDNGDGTYTITATPDSTHQFVRWDIVGQYEIVSGSVTSNVMVIKPLSDIKATGSFNGTTVDNGDHGNTSPETGVNVAPVVIIAVVATLGAAYCTKRFILD